MIPYQYTYLKLVRKKSKTLLYIIWGVYQWCLQIYDTHSSLFLILDFWGHDNQFYMFTIRLYLKALVLSKIKSLLLMRVAKWYIGCI